MSLLDDLTKHIESICPIEGIAIGDPEDKQTWRIDFDRSATPLQIANATIAITNFDSAKSDANAKIMQQILLLESAQTLRRMREASNDPYLNALEVQIAVLRRQLK